MNSLPTPPAPSPSDDEIDLFELWEIIWSEKAWIIGIAAIFGATGAAYSLLATPIYESKVTLASVQKPTSSGAGSLLAQFAPIAGIAGISASPQVPVATLKSVQFAEDFITRRELMPILLDGLEQGPGSEAADIRDAVRVFMESVLKVNEDPQSGLITLSIQWQDPQVAAQWANALVQDINDSLRDRALAEAERNVAYLKAELPVTTSVTVQQSIGRLLDQELQTVMLAKGNPEFAFKVIDPAKVPKNRSSPKRAQMTVLSTLAGGFLGLLVVFFRRAIRSRRESKAAVVA